MTENVHSSIDTEDLLLALKQHYGSSDQQTAIQWAGVTGSAVAKNDRYKPGVSDIDLIVLHQNESKYRYFDYSGIEVEVHQYSKGKLMNLLDHPEWFGVNWVWELGKFSNAVTLMGNMEDVIPSDRSKTIAVLGLVGMIVTTQKKFENGRLQRASIERELAALNCLVDDCFPLSFRDVESSKSLECVDQLQPLIQNELGRAPETLLYYPEHFDGLKFLINRWNMQMPMPQVGAAD